MKKEVPVFVPPDLSKPKNSLDLLRWVYEEPIALEYLYIDNKPKDRFIFLLKNGRVFLFTFLIALLLWCLVWSLLIFFDIPLKCRN